MLPKPGNAFAQQKELLRLREQETGNPDTPDTPMTTMSMFLGPDCSNGDVDKQTKFYNPPPGFDTQSAITGKRSFADPGAIPVHSSCFASETSSSGKQSSGFGHFKSKFTGKGKRNKEAEPATQPHPANSNMHKTQRSDSKSAFQVEGVAAQPEPTPTAPQVPRTRALTSHLSTGTTLTVATPQSKYASLLKNDGMILGGSSMSPTRSGTYAISGNPFVVNHPSIMSMTGSILDTTPHHSAIMLNPDVLKGPHEQPGLYSMSYTVPTNQPICDLQEQAPFQFQQQQIEQNISLGRGGQMIPSYQYSPSSAGTWEQLHAQYPTSMPQFSPIHPQTGHLNSSASLHAPFQAPDHFEDAKQQRQTSIKTSLYNADLSSSESESRKEELAAINSKEGNTAVVTTPEKSLLRRSVSDHSLNYSTYKNYSPDSTPIAKRNAKISLDLSGGRSVARKPVPAPFQTSRIAHGHAADVASIPKELFMSSHTKLPQSLSQETIRNSPTLNDGSGTTRGGYPPTPIHPDYQARSTFEEQMSYQFNIVHHHMEADKHHIGRWIEDAKNFIVDRSSSSLDENFLAQFRQLCVQSNGFRDYLKHILHQTSNLRAGIATDVPQVVATEMTNQMAIHENRVRGEFQHMQSNFLTLNENIDAMQRNTNNQMAQMNQKMDLLLQSQTIGTFAGTLSPTHQDRHTMQQKLREEARRRQDELLDPAAMVAKEKAGVADAARMNTAKTVVVSTPPTKTRKATPLPGKAPVMAASLTSTPPHVPQFPGGGGVGGASPIPISKLNGNYVSITDSSIPSPSAVSNAKRIRHGHGNGQRNCDRERECIEKDARGGGRRKENTRAGLTGRGLGNPDPLIIGSGGSGSGGHVHPALRYQEGIERVTGKRAQGQKVVDDEDGEIKKQRSERKENDKEREERKQVLWRRPSGDEDGEIGGKWYKAAMLQQQQGGE